jgi:hypothetical protein
MVKTPKFIYIAMKYYKYPELRLIRVFESKSNIFLALNGRLDASFEMVKV